MLLPACFLTIDLMVLFISKAIYFVPAQYMATAFILNFILYLRNNVIRNQNICLAGIGGAGWDSWGMQG